MSGLAWTLFGTFLLVLAAGVAVGIAAVIGRRGVVAVVAAASLVVVGLVGTMAVPMIAADGAASMMSGGMGSMMASTPGGGAGCQGAAAATPASVSIAGFAYCPTTAVVRAGDQLTWTNADSAAHTVTARGGAFDSGTLSHGDSWPLPTLRPGTYDYFCRIHPWMRGQLTVSG